MRRFVEEADRGQWTLLPECLDDFIDESNPVRGIDAFVDAPNAEIRTREYLTEAEVERLADAAKGNRYGQRDATMILDGLPPRLAGERAGGPSLGSDRLR